MNDLALKTLEPRELRLNTISLRGFYGKKLRKGSGGGSGDGFPVLPGDVTRWHFGGLTNEMMAAMDDPRIEDADHKGRFLSFKNFAWGGMSGVGGYSDNFSSDSWKKPSDRSDITWTSSSFNITRVMNTGVQIYYFSTWEESESVIPEKRIIVKGLEDGQVLRYMNVGNRIIEISQDGIYTIPSFTFKGANSYHGYSLAKKQESCNVTVEQLPLYPGALVFDGVDDYGTCDNFPILTKEKGFTIVAVRQFISDKISSLLSKWTVADESGAFIFEGTSAAGTKFSSAFGGNFHGLEKTILSYMTSTSYNGNTIVPGDKKDINNNLVVGRFYSDLNAHYVNSAIWEIVILDHDATEEELTKIKDYFVKTYPWLFPDQAWTVTGKTNEDEDRATIANITGNGNDLLLSNFGFAQGSGYGLYYQYFGNEFKATNGEIEGGGWNIIDNYNISHDKRIPINSIGKCFWGNKALVNGIKLRFKLTGMTEGDVLAFGYAATYDLTYTSDGIYAIDLPPVDKSYGFSLQSSLTENLPTTPVTIELLPFEYEGYLVTDGVDDIASSNTIIYEADFTFIGEWKFIQKDDTVAGINSASHLYIQNRYNRGATVMINSTFENKKNITDYMTFKAITSKGKAYDENWNEVDLLYGDGNKGPSGVNIGGQGGTEFCHMIFKNMALYMNKVFSKDDCIKAYNYLQTLKAK